ncbi:MAG: tRNA lysidine(34) synthetase TilS [Bacteroidales bacterium]|nr:tRNA lysidine(34) synthetase TilS [Bacteroidales bacterium]
MRIFVKILDNKLADRSFMLSELQQYNKVYHLFEPDEKLVLAVSGGVDSMVLTDLMQKAGAHFVVAHCNFHLRGEESDDDEQFVRGYAEKNDLQCFVNHFDTEKYAVEEGVSIEMAARDLRYAWFEELRQQLGYDKIVLAHHADDQIETFFINLLRGAGLHGLKGMKPINGVLIRPLLWASREQIRKYAVENQIVWREDHTNAETVYLRNKIRNQLMPLMDEISADARNSIGKSIGFLASENELYRQLLNERFSQLVSVDGSVQSIEKSVFQCDNGFQLLFEWLRQYGFNTDQCRFIFEGLENGLGKHFYSSSHQVTIEREVLQLTEISDKPDEIYIIEAGQEDFDLPFRMHCAYFEKWEGFEVEKKSSVGTFDLDKIDFPLTLRHWRQGDRFHPFGMKGSKLLSDFFVNQKYTNCQKENQWLLVSANGDILWVVGQRIDDRYKVQKDTKSVFECCLM